jgi:hypothetical protein
MFLHVGADVVVSIKRVISIMDLHSISHAEATREFLSLARTERKVVDVVSGNAKSMVLTADEIYLSPISSLTLKKRADFLNNNVSLDLGISAN